MYQWDHPRVCGEKSYESRHTGERLGSPPRMRGKVVHGGLHRVHLGITPAYAGKSVALGQFRGFIEDHPRVCGEKLTFCRFRQTFKGSPPRMRGKEGRHIPPAHALRITPAYAGKSTR